jgi:PTH1 family peptidyl-tRNA hydrolase
MDDTFLVVGLGNPGAEYAGTRHNAGFKLAETLAGRWRADWQMQSRFNARVATTQREGKKVMLCEPQTYMNASGDAVGAIARFYRVTLDRILIIVDDADLPLGQIRMRSEGSCGGHHGLESIEQQLGSRNYLRLRLGIGRRASDGRRITNYVLGRFEPDEREILDTVLNRAAEQVECWLSAGVKEAMNRFNGAVTAPLDKGKVE